MKRSHRLLINALLLCLSFTATCQTVNIPDANFKAYLVNNAEINTNGDTEIQITEAQSFTGLMQCASGEINSLVGIEAFTEIEVLRCFNNNLTELDLSGNLKLKILSCYTNDIASIDISMLVDLESFNGHTNQLTTLNFNSNKKLIDLLVHNNNISSLDLSDAEQLEKLIIYNNNFSSIDLSLLPNLREINISDNPIANIDVSNNLNLSTFRIDQAMLSDLDLSNNENLSVLRCNENNLSSLDLSNNKLLRALDCNSNQIANINFDSLLKLSFLDLGNNNFTELDLVHLVDLIELEVNDNSLSTLDIANGNNMALLVFTSLNNPNLECINVDDEAFAMITEWTIDETSSYSNDCTMFTSVFNQEDLQDIILSPNPVRDKLNISNTNLPIESLMVYNNTGQMLKSVIANTRLLNLLDLAKGHYTIVIIFENGQKLIRKFVKL